MAYWSRNITEDGEPATPWKPVEPRNPYVNTVADSVRELLAYRYKGKPCYEVASVHTADQLTARDALWLAIVKEAVQLEREECALVAWREMVEANITGELEDYAYNTACDDIAAAIRSRSTTDTKEPQQ
jgi:hypothetical protein